jgi:hypothetical protein
MNIKFHWAGAQNNLLRRQVVESYLRDHIGDPEDVECIEIDVFDDTYHTYYTANAVYESGMCSTWDSGYLYPARDLM